MARTALVFDVFLGSTGEASDVRGKIREKLESKELIDTALIAEISYRVSDGEDVAPQISTDGQAAINEEFVQSADVAIVIIRSRLGTPTSRAESGAAEEAAEIIKRWKRGENCQLMLCFDQQIDGRSLDAKEWERVVAFKTQVRKLGVLTKDFEGADELEQSIGPWLLHTLKSLKNKYIDRSEQDENPVRNAGEITSVRPCSELDTNDEEGPGLLDFLSSADELGANMSDALSTVVAEIEKVTKSIDLGSSELGEAILNKDKGLIKKSIDAVAIELGTFADNTELAVDDMASSFREFVSYLAIFQEFEMQSMDEEDKRIFSELPGQVLSGMAQAEEFRDALVKMPRMTTKLSRNKKRAAAVLDRLIGESMSFAKSVEDFTK